MEDPVLDEINEFFDQNFNPHSVLQEQRGKVDPGVLDVIGHDMMSWQKNWEIIASNFNVMEWWDKCGRSRYRLLYPVACCILSLPDSNGHQERALSSCTWMDGSLSQNQNDMTFQ